jgi:nitroimidazol reductase NimA-like FMN-containing flavoprotein (pyridoxamine 5'-phosphate oxidase superfamily)
MPGYGIVPATKGKGLLPWSFAAERLERTRNYMLATVTPGGAPHVMAVWGVWLDDAFYFSTSPTSRKARNIAANPRVVMTADDPRNAVIVEATVTKLDDPGTTKRVVAAYNTKYAWETPEDEAFLVARPQKVFAFIETSGSESQFAETATRWRFD